ncbi:hypothetical protein [Plesiomonas sp.]|uniref:hypothetical protein n=1 Tax=Plesiomonas sp. TaxID=2486279 RepID=UPI003F3687FD
MSSITAITYPLSSIFSKDDQLQPLAQLAMQASQRSKTELPATHEVDNINEWQSIFLQALAILPPVNSNNIGDIKAYATEVEKLLSEYPKITVEQKLVLLQAGLTQVEQKSGESAALTSLLLGCVNLQTEMQKWMSKTIMSGGESEEFTEW